MIKMHKTTYSDVVFSPEDLIVVARISLQTAYKIIKELNQDRELVVCDYIAGMTDLYAIEKFKDLFVPKSWDVY